MSLLYTYSPTWVDRVVPGLQEELESWLGTRYKKGACVKGSVTDCARFVSKVLCTLLSCDSEPDFQQAGEEPGLHNAAVAQADCDRICAHWPQATQVLDNTLAPGDVVILGPPSGGPTMAMICSADKFVLFRVAAGVGVVRSGFDLPNREVKAVYRFWSV